MILYFTIPNIAPLITIGENEVMDNFSFLDPFSRCPPAVSLSIIRVSENDHDLFWLKAFIFVLYQCTSRVPLRKLTNHT